MRLQSAAICSTTPSCATQHSSVPTLTCTRADPPGSRAASSYFGFTPHCCTSSCKGEAEIYWCCTMMRMSNSRLPQQLQQAALRPHAEFCFLVSEMSVCGEARHASVSHKLSRLPTCNCRMGCTGSVLGVTSGLSRRCKAVNK